MHAVSRRDPFAIPSAVVTAVATVAAGFCGLAASIPYVGRHDPILYGAFGILLGGGSGAAAGICWSRWMRRTAGREGEREMVSAGAIGGLAAGAASTIVLHVALAVGSLDLRVLDSLPVGFGIAIAVGAPLGAIGGFWFRWPARAAARMAREASRGDAPDGPTASSEEAS
jgi:hypothetical protein